MKRLLSLLFLIGILLCAPASYADVYSWTDENGVKSFGNEPPENAANVKLIFKEKPHDPAADQQRTATDNKEVTELIRELEEDEERQAAEDRRKAAAAAANREPTPEERIALEKKRLQAKIADLEDRYQSGELRGSGNLPTHASADPTILMVQKSLDEQKRQRYQVRLPLHIIRWLQDHPESAGRLVERALVMTYDIKEPKERR